MFDLRKLLRPCALGLCLVIGGISNAHAIALSFVPGSSTVAPGGSQSIDVVATFSASEQAAQQVVSAFDFTVNFDPLIVTGTEILYTMNLGDPSLGEAIQGVDGTDELSFTGLDDIDNTSGIIQLTQVSFLFDSELQTLQIPLYPEITLATLTFSGLIAGVSDLSFGPSALTGGIDIVGLNADSYDDPGLEQGQITVQASVPAPGTLLLLPAGLYGLLRRRRR